MAISEDAPMVQDNFQLPQYWKKKLTALAKEKGSSRSQLIRNAIYEKYIQEKKQ